MSYRVLRLEWKTYPKEICVCVCVVVKIMRHKTTACLSMNYSYALYEKCTDKCCSRPVVLRVSLYSIAVVFYYTELLLSESNLQKPFFSLGAPPFQSVKCFKINAHNATTFRLVWRLRVLTFGKLTFTVGEFVSRQVGMSASGHGLLELNQVLVSREFLTPPCLWHLY